MTTKLERLESIIWKYLDYGREVEDFYEFAPIQNYAKRNSIRNLGEFEDFLRVGMNGKLIIKNGIVRPNLPADRLWHATDARKVPEIVTDALLPTGGEIEHGWGFSIFLAQHPYYAAFKSGERGDSNQLAMVEIRRNYFRECGYKLRLVDTQGIPFENPVQSLILERARNGQLEIGCFGRLEPSGISRIYLQESSRGVLPDIPEPYKDKVVMLGSPGNITPLYWNRAIVEANLC